MRKFFLIALIFTCFNSFGQQGSKNFIDQNFIEVTGKAEMEIIPNEIYLKIVVDEDDFKGKKSISDIESEITNGLEEIGVNPSDNLSIIDLTSNFKNYWLKDSEIKSKKVYQLKVNDAETAGKVYQKLESLGVSNISIDRVDHSDIQKYRQQVKVKAIKAAKDKALLLTKAIDQTIGRALYVKELDDQIINSLRGKVGGVSNIVIRGAFSSKSIKQKADIEFEKIKLEYSILVYFEIKEQ